MYNNLFINEPKNNSIIQNRFPEISLISLDTTYYKKLSNIKMYVNNKKVNFKIIDNKIIYIPRKKLHSGTQKIKITLYDKNKEKKELKWCFLIETSSNIEKYNFYFGIPHSHTGFSTGKGTPTEAFNYAKKKGIDFLIVTDHGGHLYRDKKSNSSKNSKWEILKNDASKFNTKNDKFLSLGGFELTSKNFGDFNVLNSNNIYKGKIKDFNKFTMWLKNQPNPIVSINHPHKYIESFKYNRELDKFINFIEVGNGSPPFKYLNGEKYYYNLLDKGWHIGAINGQDNHRMNWGDTDNLTVVICKSLNKKDFYEALNYRRTYSSETRSLKLIFKVNGKWMGSILSPSKKLNFEIYAEDKKNPIKKVQIISNGEKIIKEKSLKKKGKLKWDFSIPYKKNCWYVAKVIYKDDKMGISSAIFT
ncbi:CehA/McbA family metallohydrolase [Clostridium novyi]|uniref:CehA/McbA family metallohydrolase n=1 Tax=Clostridium novyi TaxID=1542 RepID=UPI00068C8394|nr:CehA/McbA family metallohydrolase [Clostridium novyi]